jgi:DNA-binding winged helix-turn-helix (wHTH) protein
MSIASVLPAVPTAAHPRPDLHLVPGLPSEVPAVAAPVAEARGFALFVGIDEATARAAGIDLATLVEQLRRVTAELVPAAETYAAVAFAPTGAGGRDLDIVRRALTERATGQRTAPTAVRRRTGIVLDLSRKRLTIDGDTAPLTYREFELLQHLVLREGRTVARADIIGTLWGEGDTDIPNERTIDVHIRRLRAKLGEYGDIVRTIRGSGYRFDRHADVVIRYGTGPSPDRF